MHNLDLRYSWPWSNNDNVVDDDDDDIENVAPKNAILQKYNLAYPPAHPSSHASQISRLSGLSAINSLKPLPNDRESG